MISTVQVFPRTWDVIKREDGLYAITHLGRRREGGKLERYIVARKLTPDNQFDPEADQIRFTRSSGERIEIVGSIRRVFIPICNHHLTPSEAEILEDLPMDPLDWEKIDSVIRKGLVDRHLVREGKYRIKRNFWGV